MNSSGRYSVLLQVAGLNRNRKCTGTVGQAALASASILIWGTGEAAALIGIPFGTHEVRLAGADGRNPW